MAQIDKPNLYFNTKLYTGNGGTNHSITGVGFQPDWTWIKSRDDAYSHFVFDAVRGVGKQIHPNLTNAESTNLNNLYSFDSDGFSLAQSGNDDVTNRNNSNFASWNWKANGAGSANTDGTINSTVSVNTTAGFSIVSYTGNGTNGATVGHGLGVAPKVIMIKRLTTGDWLNYHSAIGGDKYLILNKTDAEATASGIFSSSTNTFGFPTSYGGTNPSSTAMIAYCFAEKTGYSKFGSYNGNGNADGTFVYTGFKPAFLMYKRTAGTSDWVMVDNKRDPINVCDEELYANLNASAGTTDLLDFTSNGFKCRRSHTSQNANGETYIYMAFAENPIVGSNNIPATAR